MVYICVLEDIKTVVIFLVAAEHEAAEQKLKEVRIEYFQLKEEYDDLKNKMSFFTDVSDLYLHFYIYHNVSLYPQGVVIGDLMAESVMQLSISNEGIFMLLSSCCLYVRIKSMKCRKCL